MPTQPYISKSDAKVLVIGHDPKLQKSNIVADSVYLQIIISGLNQNPAAKRENMN